MIYRACFIVLTLLAPVTNAAAQHPDIPTGRQIRIFGDSIKPATITGHLEAVNQEALVIKRLIDSPGVVVPWRHIQRIEMAAPNPTRPHRTRIGGLIGGGFGIALFALAVSVSGACLDCPENDNATAEFIGIGAAFTVSGALLGAGLARFTTPPVWQRVWSREYP